MQVTQDSEKDNHEVGKKDNVCTLCKEYTAEALSYLDANKTQEEIIHILHGSCSKLHSLKEEVLFAKCKRQLFLIFLKTTKINMLDYHVLVGSTSRTTKFC